MRKNEGIFCEIKLVFSRTAFALNKGERKPMPKNKRGRGLRKRIWVRIRTLGPKAAKPRVTTHWTSFRKAIGGGGVCCHACAF